jgi:pimeloyl-ACP methyl ester carboxylesterase
MMTRRYPLLDLLTFFLIFSCSDDDKSPESPQTNLVSAEFIDSRTASEIQFLIQFSGRDLDPSLFQYDVKLYRVTYTTMYNEQEIEASGVVAVPITNESMGMLSFQHGTMVQQREAPSAQDEDSFDLLLYGAIASTGFITVVPDFIGFGASSDIFHPYYVEEATATAVIDNIRAAEKVASDNNVNFNDRLFLAGYSQGGYATLAAHKAIEEGALEDMELIASFPASGGYDLKAMQDYFFSLDQYDQPYYIGYVAKSYQTYYGLQNVISDIFNEPYASRIPDLFNGTNSSGTINAQLTTTISQLIKADIRTNFETNAQYQYLVNLFEENSLTDWTPHIPVYLYHGTADTTVPYENSQITYDQLIANGASSSVVNFIPLPGADHASGVEPYIDDVITKLQQLK